MRPPCLGDRAVSWKEPDGSCRGSHPERRNQCSYLPRATAPPCSLSPPGVGPLALRAGALRSSCHPPRSTTDRNPPTLIKRVWKRWVFHFGAPSASPHPVDQRCCSPGKAPSGSSSRPGRSLLDRGAAGGSGRLFCGEQVGWLSSSEVGFTLAQAGRLGEKVPDTFSGFQRLPLPLFCCSSGRRLLYASTAKGDG